jgi:hypothetical protein
MGGRNGVTKPVTPRDQAYGIRGGGRSVGKTWSNTLADELNKEYQKAYEEHDDKLDAVRYSMQLNEERRKRFISESREISEDHWNSLSYSKVVEKAKAATITPATAGELSEKALEGMFDQIKRFPGPKSIKPTHAILPAKYVHKGYAIGFDMAEPEPPLVRQPMRAITSGLECMDVGSRKPSWLARFRSWLHS